MTNEHNAEYLSYSPLFPSNLEWDICASICWAPTKRINFGNYTLHCLERLLQCSDPLLFYFQFFRASTRWQLRPLSVIWTSSADVGNWGGKSPFRCFKLLSAWLWMIFNALSSKILNFLLQRERSGSSWMVKDVRSKYKEGDIWIWWWPSAEVNRR